LHGDGWLPYFTVPSNDPVVLASSVTSMEQFAQKIERIETMRDKADRHGAFDIATGAPYRPKAATRAEAERFVNEARQAQACGATWIWTPLPAPSRAGYLESVAWFAEEVIAAFAKA
jgi:hypothetical protein